MRPRMLARATALTLFVLANVALPFAAGAEQPTPFKVPTNAAECDRLYSELIFSAGEDGAAIQHFLIGTNADKIMPELCRRGSYWEAYRFAVPLIEGNRKPLPKARQQPSNCFLGSNC